MSMNPGQYTAGILEDLDTRLSAVAIHVRAEVERLAALVVSAGDEIDRLHALDRRPVKLGATMGNNLVPRDGVEEDAGTPYDAVRVFMGPPSVVEVGKAVSLVHDAAAAGQSDVVVSFAVKRADWPAAGSPGAWVLRWEYAGRELSKVAVERDVTVWVATRHEPEDDIRFDAKAGLAPHLIARDQWLAMNDLAAEAFSLPGLRFGVILMGAHSVATPTWTSPLYPVWYLELAVPASAKWVGFDLYQWWQTVDGNGKITTSWSDVPAGVRALAEFCNARGIGWWVTEYGINERAFDVPAGARDLADLVEMIRDLRGLGLLYFNTKAVDPAGLPASDPRMDRTRYAYLYPGSDRRAEWVRLLKAEHGVK